MENKLKEAIEILCKSLREDPEYFRAWQANIAMVFKDEWNTEWYQQSEQDEKAIHKLANQAATNFLNLLMK